MQNEYGQEVSQEAAAEAHEQKKEAIRLQKARNLNTFDMGKVLHPIREVYESDELNGTYEALQLYGFQFWYDLVKAPEESGGLDIPYSTADRSIRLYRKYILELREIPELISRFSYTKLDAVSSAVNAENLPYWKELIIFSTLEDLVKERNRIIASPVPTNPGDKTEPITTAIKPETAKDWIQAWDLVQQTIKDGWKSPQDKIFIKEVYSESLTLFRQILKRRARGTTHKKSCDKLIRAIDTIVKL